jgi:hypothetical protein
VSEEKQLILGHGQFTAWLMNLVIVEKLYGVICNLENLLKAVGFCFLLLFMNCIDIVDGILQLVG